MLINKDENIAQNSLSALKAVYLPCIYVSMPCKYLLGPQPMAAQILEVPLRLQLFNNFLTRCYAGGNLWIPMLYYDGPAYTVSRYTWTASESEVACTYCGRTKKWDW